MENDVELITFLDGRFKFLDINSKVTKRSIDLQ